MAEADIVRLAQLIAFVNYQARVIAGLKLVEAARCAKWCANSPPSRWNSGPI